MVLPYLKGFLYILVFIPLLYIVWICFIFFFDFRAFIEMVMIYII
jgi:hypothetical protein